MIKKVLLLLVLVVLWLSGCAANPPVRYEVDQGVEVDREVLVFTPDLGSYSSAGEVIYYHDKEREVGVWVYTGYNKGGIAVLPDKDYLLGE